VYVMLRRITGAVGVALSVTLLFTWSYYVWTVGLFAEVYAPQLLTLAAVGLLLAGMMSPGVSVGASRVAGGSKPPAEMGNLRLPLSPLKGLKQPTSPAQRVDRDPRPVLPKAENVLQGLPPAFSAPLVGFQNHLARGLQPLATGSKTSLPLLTGLMYGIAVAMHPASILFAPGMAVCFRLARVSWRRSALAATLAALIVLGSLLYFPLRFHADPALNLAGSYDAAGSFVPRDLATPEGVVWMISGRQFGGLFFAEGVLPTAGQLVELLVLFAGNWLGFGVVIGLYGLFVLWRGSSPPSEWGRGNATCRAGWGRGLLWGWIALFAPYTLFYATYGAGDRQLMFGPSLLLWTVPLAVGLREIIRQMAPRWRVAVLVILPALALAVNFPLLDLSGDFSVRERSALFMQAVPQEAVVFARWHDITPLEYLHTVEGVRPDLRLYNLFLFPTETLRPYLQSLIAAGEVVWLVDVDPVPLLPGVSFEEITLTPDNPDVPGFTVYAVGEPPGL
ncbi:MAG: hypothetical protein JW910_05925, partial [Anaerolineae bacterium]|nr:hypothetical protein [Anaerolineae bacterium]